MTGAFRDAPGSAAKTIKPEASHTKPGRTLLQVKTENKKNEVEERRGGGEMMFSCGLALVLGSDVWAFTYNGLAKKEFQNGVRCGVLVPVLGSDV